MRRLFPPFVGLPGSIGFLTLRLVAGAAMALHGWPKIQNATSWMGPDAAVPGALQAMAALAEFGGGLCWMAGLLTPLASFLILCTMFVAAFLVHMASGDPFVAKEGGPSYELALVYFGVAMLLLLAGPGRLSADYLLFGRRPPPAA
jgi:putative oxidoreductase